MGLASNDSLWTPTGRPSRADPVAAFGAVVAFNRVVDARDRRGDRAGNAYEALVAPAFSDDALAVLAETAST